MKYSLKFLPLAALAALAACQDRTTEESDADPATTGAGTDTATQTPSPDAPVSIIRPDVEQPPMPEEPLEPLEVTIGFPGGGSDLDDEAEAALELLFASAQVKNGGTITLRAHSDAGGRDTMNMGVSQARGDAVREWLIEKGIPANRVRVIAFGEQNPARPNALPDGSPNEAGRAANRRVEATVTPVDVPGVVVEADS